MTVYEITIPRWDEFQIYGKSTIWIRTYTRLLSDDAYLNLTLPQRGLLHGLWLEYARANHGRPVNDTRPINGSTAAMSRRIGQRITSTQLDALNHAGFIGLSSRPGLDEVNGKARREEKGEKELQNQGPKGPSLRLVENERPPAVDGFTRLGDELDALIAEQRRTG